MKRRFRGVSIFLAAILVLSLASSGFVYAGDNPADTQTEKSIIVTDSMDSQNDSASVSDEKSGAEKSEISDGAMDTKESDATDDEQKSEESTDDKQRITAKLQTACLDASSVDLDALTEWLQEHPERLQSFYDGDADVIDTLTEKLGAEKDAITDCSAQLKGENSTLVQALENGTDVLNIISMNTAEDAAAQLGVDVTAIKLFDIRLGYLSDQLSAASDEAEKQNQLDDWTQKMQKALSDEETLNTLAAEYDVEPAVLAALLRTMGIEPIDDETASLTITNVVDSNSDSVTTTLRLTIYLWDPSKSTSDINRALTGTYGDITFTYRNVSYNEAYGLNYDIPAGKYGYYNLQMDPGQTVNITGLPTDCSYFIVEGGNQYYYVKQVKDTFGSVNQMIDSVYVKQAKTHNDVVYYFGYAPQSFRFTNMLYTDNPDRMNDELEFTVYFYKYGSSSNSPLFDEDQVEIEINCDGSEDGSVEKPNLGSSMQFTKTDEITLDGIGRTGVYNMATFKLKSGQSIVFKNLGSDFGFYVVQSYHPNWAVHTFAFKTILLSGTGGTDDGYDGVGYDGQYCYLNDSRIRHTMTFVSGQQSLSITKKVENSDTTRYFVFDVYLAKVEMDTRMFRKFQEADYELSYSNGSGEGLPTTVHFQIRDDMDPVSVTSSDGSVQCVSARILVPAGETVTIKDLPFAVGYRIIEEPVTNYTMTNVTATTGTLDGNVIKSSPWILDDENVVVTNTYEAPVGIDMTLTNTVTGNLGDKDKVFNYKVALTDQDGNALSDRDFQVKLPDETESIFTTDENGILTIGLTHEQQATVMNLPEGTRYTVTLTDADDYTTTFEVQGGTYDEAQLKSQSGDMGSEDIVVNVTNHLEGVLTDPQSESPENDTTSSTNVVSASDTDTPDETVATPVSTDTKATSETTSESTSESNVNTGDTTNLTLWYILMIVSSLGALRTIYIRRKRRAE